MKRIFMIIMIALIGAPGVQAQHNLNLGAGYFGNTLTYPGLLLEVEWESALQEKAALPLLA